jgi:ABC-type polysaccharide/polyol phosphate export permease
LRISYMMLVCSLIWRNLIAFIHNLVIYIPICIYGQVPVNIYTLAVIPGLFFLCLNGAWIVIVLGLLCARFRDTQQVVLSLLQISMFVTPILWSPKLLKGRAVVLVDYNMIYHYIVIVRDPLLGQPPSAWSWFMVIVATIVGWAFTLYLYSRFQRRIAYWL